jgi:hypothetical protein
MAAYFKFEDTIRAIFEGEHNFDGTDTIMIYLSNATPSASLDAVKADLAEIGAGNGYNAGGEDSTNTGSEAGGVYTVAGSDIVWTAGGGTIGPFRYAVGYNDTHASDGLTWSHDYGSSITLLDGETFTWDTGANLFTAS